MSYFIKNTYPEKNNIPSDIYFKGWVNNLSINEEYTNWNISGDFYIYSNSFLPNYSFYLNIQTYLFLIENIELNWYKNFVNEKIDQSSNDAYKIDMYKFNTNINLSKTELYNKEIINQSFEMNFNIVFNQGVFNDFKIECDEITRRNFIGQINQFQNTKILNYSNTYYLDEYTQQINFSLDKRKESSMNIQVPNMSKLDTSINNLINIIKFSNNIFDINQIKINLEYKLNDSNKIYKFSEKLKNLSYITKLFSVNINKSFEFDLVNNTFSLSNNKLKGFFIPKISYGSLNVEFNVKYMNQLKRFILNREFSFESDYYENSRNAIKIEKFFGVLPEFNEVYFD